MQTSTPRMSSARRSQTRSTAAQRSLVVDLAETTFIDSMTLGVLLGAVKRLRPVGGRVSVVCTDANIRRIFEITLLDRVFALQESREAALMEAEAAQGRPATA